MRVYTKNVNAVNRVVIQHNQPITVKNLRERVSMLETHLKYSYLRFFRIETLPNYIFEFCLRGTRLNYWMISS